METNDRPVRRAGAAKRGNQRRKVEVHLHGAAKVFGHIEAAGHEKALATLLEKYQPTVVVDRRFYDEMDKLVRGTPDLANNQELQAFWGCDPKTDPHCLGWGRG